MIDGAVTWGVATARPPEKPASLLQLASVGLIVQSAAVVEVAAPVPDEERSCPKPATAQNIKAQSVVIAKRFLIEIFFQPHRFRPLHLGIARPPDRVWVEAGISREQPENRDSRDSDDEQ
jgi:hypothetical protein